nr:hypothetical protein [uncultured Rhodopila sp.]
MTESPNKTKPPRHPNTTVVLLAPELFLTPPDTAALIASLTQPHARVRLLVRLASEADMTLAEAVARAGVAVQVLVPADITPPPTALPLVRMPPDSGKEETNDLALALSDCLLVPADRPKRRLVGLAEELHKHFLVPGGQPPVIHPHPSISHRLDPEQPGSRIPFPRVWGRVEQFLLELAAFAWRGPKRDGAAKSRRRLHACAFKAEWPHTPYFAPEGWEDLAPDRDAQDTGRPIVAAFDQLDRSALYGSYIHRDLAWAAYLAAASAVLFAVAGHIVSLHKLPDLPWAVAELAMLVIVLATTLSSRRVRLQDRWTACRFGAEQLRIARMCLPLLVVPRALCSVDKVPPRADESKRALAEVKRAVRDQGLPELAAAPSALEAARWLKLVVKDQTTYHHDNHHRLECAEDRLIRLTVILFGVAVVAVVAELVDYGSSLLLLATAAMPAFAAAIHGVATRLGFVHRAQLSLEAAGELEPIQDDLDKMIDQAEADWPNVRTLAARAAEAMARETTSWHSQVRRQKDVIV